MTEQPPASGNRWEPDADGPDTVPIRSEVDADTSTEPDAEAEADAPPEPPTTYDATPAARRPWTARVRPAVAGAAAAVVVIAGLGEGTSGQTTPPGTGPDAQPGQDDDPASSDGSET
jgi:hypothetical protein